MTQTPTGTPSPRPTFTPKPSPTITFTSTITPTLIPVCNDYTFGDLNDPGIPEKATRFSDAPGPGFMEYDAETFYVYQKEMHHRMVTVAIKKDFAGSDEQVYHDFSDFIFDTWAYSWNIFGGNPYPSYTIVIGNDLPYVNDNSTSVIYGTGFEANVPLETHELYAHELFHVWNGASFDQEPDVWFKEGVTTYYGYRYGDVEIFNKFIEGDYSTYQYLYDNGKDLPLKNLTDQDKLQEDTRKLIYSKGDLVTYLLDVELKKYGHNLDEVLRILYQKYSIYGQSTAISDENIKEVLNGVSGVDFTDFFNKYIYGKEPLPQIPKLPYMETPFRFMKLCHDNNTVVAPFLPLLTNQGGPIVIDGKADDWKGISPILTDRSGDSLAGYDGDMTELYSKTDDNFLYFMMKAGKTPVGKRWTFDFYLDTIPGGACPPSDKGLRMDSSSVPKILMFNLVECNFNVTYWDYLLVDSLFVWDEVIEVKIPLVHFIPSDYFIVVKVISNIESKGTTKFLKSDTMQTP